MKPGDLIQLRDGYGSSSYSSIGSLPNPNGPYFPPRQRAVVIKIEDAEPLPGCSRQILLLGANGLGWLPKHYLEAI